MKEKFRSVWDFNTEKLFSVIVVLFTTVALGIWYIVGHDMIVIFLASMFLAALTILKSKISLFSIKTLIVNYIQIPFIIQYYTGHSYGLLESTHIVRPHTELFFVSILFYNLTIYLLLTFTNILQKERERYGTEFFIKGKMKYILIAIAIACTFIAFPRLPFLSGGGERFDALLPGHGWNHIAIIALIFLVGNLFKKDKPVIFTYIFCIGWFLVNYERVDMIGLIVFIALLFIARKKITLSLKSIAITASAIVLGFVSFVTIGSVRAGYGHNFNLRSILVQSTASDLAYVYGISIDFGEYHKRLNGLTYVTYAVEAIPLLSTNNSVESVLGYSYNFPGGEFILSAQMINFGLWSIPIFAIIEFAVIYLVLTAKSKIALFYTLFIAATLFRSNWYGLRYIETGALYIIPAIYFLSRKYIVYSTSHHTPHAPKKLKAPTYVHEK